MMSQRKSGLRGAGSTTTRSIPERRSRRGAPPLKLGVTPDAAQTDNDDMSRHLSNDPSASAGSLAATPEEPARRRFVRGVFAAPAVMTVCSGSAFGADPMASATCLVKGQGGTDPLVDPFWTGAESPTYLRVTVYEQGGVRYIRYGDLTAIGARGVTIPVTSPGLDDFIPLDENGALDPNKPVLQTHRTTAAAPTATNTGVVVRIDGSGFVVGTGRGSGTPGALVSMTCWMSVTPFV